MIASADLTEICHQLVRDSGGRKVLVCAVDGEVLAHAGRRARPARSTMRPAKRSPSSSPTSSKAPPPAAASRRPRTSSPRCRAACRVGCPLAPRRSAPRPRWSSSSTAARRRSTACGSRCGARATSSPSRSRSSRTPKSPPATRRLAPAFAALTRRRLSHFASISGTIYRFYPHYGRPEPGCRAHDLPPPRGGEDRA